MRLVSLDHRCRLCKSCEYCLLGEQVVALLASLINLSLFTEKRDIPTVPIASALWSCCLNTQLEELWLYVA